MASPRPTQSANAELRPKQKRRFATTITGIVKGGTDYAMPASGVVTMLDRQTLMGGGSTILVKGLETGIIVPFSAAGSRPTIVGCGCDVIYMDHATRLSGLNFEGVGIEVRDDSQLVAIDNLRMTNSFIAIAIDDRTRDVTIDNVSISGSMGGIGIRNDNTNLSIHNVTISDTALGGIGMGYDNTVTMENVRFVNAGIAALSIEGDNTVSMSNSAISGNTYTAGIELLDTDNKLSGTGNTHNISGGVLCNDVAGSQTGSFGFSGTPGSCP